MSSPVAPSPLSVDPPPDPEALRARVQQLEAAQAAWHAEQQRLRLRIRDLEQQLQRWRQPTPAPPPVGLLSLFGDQPVASPADAPADAAPPVPPTAPARGGSATARTTPRGPQPLDPALPREEIALPDPPLASRRCADRGVPLVPGFTEQLEVLARRPAVYVVKRYTRTVWVSPAKSAPLMTPWPADVLPRARMHASVVAHIAAAHFAEHVSYCRLEQQLARIGVTLARSAQVSLMGQLDTSVAPLVAHLRALVLASSYVHLDATPVDVCDPARPGAARSATLWA